MPRVNLAKRTPPPIDWTLAAILERKTAYGYDLHKMAEVGGCGYDYMRRLIRMPTEQWPYNILRRVLGEFGIKLQINVGGTSPVEEKK